MADYTGHTWVDDTDDVTAARLNNIEAGVEDAAETSKQRGPLASRPAAASGNKNWIWVASDDDNRISYSDGSSWYSRSPGSDFAPENLIYPGPEGWNAGGAMSWTNGGATRTHEPGIGIGKVVTTNALSAEGLVHDFGAGMTFRAGVTYTALIRVRGNAGGEQLRIGLGKPSASDSATKDVTPTTSQEWYSVQWTPTADRTSAGVAVFTRAAVVATFFVDEAIVGDSDVRTAAPHLSAYVASTGNVTVSNPGTSTFDGTAIAAGNRVLLWRQTTASQNGIYVFNGSAVPMTRAPDMDRDVDLYSGRIVYVQKGTIYTGRPFVIVTDTTGGIVLGTDSFNFDPLEGIAGSTAMTAFTGGTIYSPAVTITHGLRTTPKAVVGTIRGGGIRGMFPITQNIGATTFDAQSVSADGVPLNTQSAGTLDWFAHR